MRRLSGIRIWGMVLLMAGCGTDDPRVDARDETTSLLVDATTEAGLETFRHQTGAVGDIWFPETMGSGGAFVDYNGDDWPDLLLVGGGVWEGSDQPAPPALALYENNQDGTFALRTEAAGLADLTAYGMGVIAADYDNDGDQDVFFTTVGRNLLLRNDEGRFMDVSTEAGLSDAWAWSTTAVFFDANRDGHLDLYVGNYVEWTPDNDLFCSTDGTEKGYCTPGIYEGTPPRFYLNDGDGTFTERTEAAGFLPNPGQTLGAVELDFNKDGWPDLAVANDLQPDQLYENNGDGTFTEKGVVSGIAFDERGHARAGMGIDVGDVNNDGSLTLVVGNFSGQMMSVFEHLGNGLFLDRAAASQVGIPSLRTLTFGLFLFDVDFDGDLDLFAANGHIQPDIEKIQDNSTYREPAHLFINEGAGTFSDLAPAHGGVLTKLLVGRGAAYGDYDRDGDLDVVMTENGGPVHLWQNQLIENGAAPHYLRVELEGRESNRDGVGARIVTVTGDTRRQRWVRTGASYLSQSEMTVTFGLGDAARVDSLLVYWPSGTVDRMTDVEANQTLTIVEGAGEGT